MEWDWQDPSFWRKIFRLLAALLSGAEKAAAELEEESQVFDVQPEERARERAPVSRIRKRVVVSPEEDR